MPLPLSGSSAQIIEKYRACFAFLGFQLDRLSTDPDRLTIQLSQHVWVESVDLSIRIESMMYASMHLFSQLLHPTAVVEKAECETSEVETLQFQRGNCYFINLYPRPFCPDYLWIEIDYMKTIRQVMYLEAYAYDAQDRLIGKGGYMMVLTEE